METTVVIGVLLAVATAVFIFRKPKKNQTTSTGGFSLSPEQFDVLRAKGYTDQQINQAMNLVTPTTTIDQVLESMNQ
jgi:hypothetical protein